MKIPNWIKAGILAASIAGIGIVSGSVTAPGVDYYAPGGTDVAVADGGTGASSLTGLLQGNGTSAFTAISDSSTTGQTLRVTGASTYAWGALDLSNASALTNTLPVGNGGTGQTALSALTANPTGTVGLTAVNGSATTFMRSDGAPALSQAIVPTWTGQHTFQAVTLFADGTAAAPGISFPGDPNTGAFRAGPDNFAISTGGVYRLSVGTTYSEFTNILVLSDGSVSAPSYSFNADVDTGEYRIGSNDFGFTAGGVLQLEIKSSAILMPTLASSSAAQTGTVCWSSPGGNLTVDTTVACLASTMRVKQNVLPIDVGLKEVMALRPISYELKPEHNPKHLGRMVGLIAEEVQKTDSRLVALDDKGEPLGVRYMQMTAVLIKAIQEQQGQIDQLKAVIARNKLH